MIETHGTALTAPHHHAPMVLCQTSATNYHAAQAGHVVPTKVLRMKGAPEEEDVVVVKTSIPIVRMVLLQYVLMALSQLTMRTSLVYQVAQNAQTELVSRAGIDPELPTGTKVRETDSVATESEEGRAQKRAVNLQKVAMRAHRSLKLIQKQLKTVSLIWLL